MATTIFPWTSSLFRFFFDSLLETSLWNWAQLYFIVHRELPSSCGCQSCLLAIGHLQEHSEAHNSTLHNGALLCQFSGAPPAAQSWWIMYEMIRIPVRRSDTWSWTSRRFYNLCQHSRDASCPMKMLGLNWVFLKSCVQSFFGHVVIFVNEITWSNCIDA